MTIRCHRQGEDFFLDGAVDAFLIHELKNSPEPVKNLYLNSYGGQVQFAFEVAKYIRAQGINTFLRAGAVCESACTLVFQAGKRRVADRHSELMYHGVRDPHLSQKHREEIRSCLASPRPSCMEPIERRRDELMELTQMLFDSYEHYGASPKLSDIYWAQEKDPNWWKQGNYIQLVDWRITGEEARMYNVATELLGEDRAYRIVSM